MTPCDECEANLNAFLDDELHGRAFEAFVWHLERCSTCRAKLDDQRSLIMRVRAARVREVAPASLRERITLLIGGRSEFSPSLLSLPQKTRVKPTLRTRSSWRSMLALAASVLVISATVLLSIVSQRSLQAKSFVDAAVEAHQQQLAGSSPLRIKATSAAEVAGWFADKLPFRFRLPIYREIPGETPKYTLIGGRLIYLNTHPAAYLAYRIQKDLISLLMTSSSNAIASGGEITSSKRLNFHSSQKQGLQVVTWSVHNLTYALVSDVTVPVSQSCSVCHSSPRDRDMLQNLHSRSDEKWFEHKSPK